MSGILRSKRQGKRRKATNLSLSADTIRKGADLARFMNRPSLSNVVEHLISEAFKAQEVRA